ncbi:MAG: tetratricopeptide repeat protein, partial [Thermoanaerobaculia bacterium]|nr:tetratricopeptide repeat protein [Thermoanaerobaculia bacterium]
LREMRDSKDEAERRALEVETAEILRRIEEMRGEASSDEDEGDEPQDVGRAKVGGFLWGIGVAAVVGFVIFFVATSATERGEGGSVTGGIATAEPVPQQLQTSPDLQNLELYVSKNPDDLDARLELARVYLMQQEMMKVWDQTQYVLERSPGHPRARAYQGVVRLAMGQTDMALEMLEAAIADDPTLLDARIHLALAYLQLGRPQEAVRELENAKEIHPAQAPMIDELLEEVMQRWPEVTSEE